MVNVLDDVLLLKMTVTIRINAKVAVCLFVVCLVVFKFAADT